MVSTFKIVLKWLTPFRIIMNFSKEVHYFSFIFWNFEVIHSKASLLCVSPAFHKVIEAAWCSIFFFLFKISVFKWHTTKKKKKKRSLTHELWSWYLISLNLKRMSNMLLNFKCVVPRIFDFISNMLFELLKNFKLLIISRGNSIEFSLLHLFNVKYSKKQN